MYYIYKVTVWALAVRAEHPEHVRSLENVEHVCCFEDSRHKCCGPLMARSPPAAAFKDFRHESVTIGERTCSSCSS